MAKKIKVTKVRKPAVKKGKIEKVMHEFKHRELHSGSKKGPKVKSRKQAVAIAISEARKAGANIPKKRGIVVILKDIVRKLILILGFSLSMPCLMSMYRFDKCDYIMPESLSCYSLIALISGDLALAFDGEIYPISRRSLDPELIRMDLKELLKELGVYWEVNVNGRSLIVMRTCSSVARELVEAGIPTLSEEFGALVNAQAPKSKILKIIHNSDQTLTVKLIARGD